ncbi:MAG: Mur ligase family protein, partial [Planctomycetaceae bacterium]
MSLRKLFPTSSFVGCADVRVVEATEASGACRPGVLFAALPGTRVDGTKHIGEALERGAASLLVRKPVTGVSVPQCVVPNVRQAYAELCSALAGTPSRRLATAGVTGTNGKTTTTWLVRSLLKTAGRQTGLLGTIEYSDGVHSEPARLTTPDAKTLTDWLAAMVARRTTHAAMELSSHALDQDRAAGTALDVAIVTNVTQDHFDYHPGHAAYLASKARILDHLKRGGLAVINVDDPGSRSLLERIGPNVRTCTYGLSGECDVTATILHESLTGSVFRLRVGGASAEVRTSLIGRHNVSNCLAAAAAATEFGLSIEQTSAGIEALTTVPGRLERIDGPWPFHVFVDYAHTDDALRNCIGFLGRLSE